ncbi:MAG: DUF6275 family protein, partial [Enterococcus sp.]
MNHNQFINKALELVKDYALEHFDKSEATPEVTPFVVWSCKTLQNSKALLSTNISDGM